MSVRAWSVALLAMMILAEAAMADQAMVTIDSSFDVKKAEAVGQAQVGLERTGDAAAVRVAVPKDADIAGVALRAPGGKWDLSEYEYVMADVRNAGKSVMKVRCRVDNPGVAATAKMQFGIHPEGNFVSGDVTLGPGQSATVQVELRRRKPDWIKVDLFGMVCYPWGQCESSDPAKSAGTVDAANISNVLLFVRNAFADQAFEVSGIRAVGKYREPAEILRDPAKFFPFIDEFGQYMHEDWPGKIHAAGDLAKNKAAEEKDLAGHSGIAGWDQYGGWQGGPALKATGWFYVTKYNGKWWMVDPEGKLFFSNGMDCVNSHEGTTTIDEREKWFAKLPAKDSEFAPFYATRPAFPRGHYAGKETTMYDFTEANLLRKYGSGWKDAFADTAHRRLRSWGFNTIANWSDTAVYSQDKNALHGERVVPQQAAGGGRGMVGQEPGFVRSGLQGADSEGDGGAGRDDGEGSVVHRLFRRQRDGVGGERY